MKNTVIALLSVLLLSLSLLTHGGEELELPDFAKTIKEGSWVLYESKAGASTVKTKQTVVKLTVEKITMRSETIMPGVKIPPQEITVDRKAKKIEAKNGPKPEITRGKVRYKGKTLDCYIVKMDINGMKAVSYYSESVPFGLVKTEINGKESMVLADYGVK